MIPGPTQAITPQALDPKLDTREYPKWHPKLTPQVRKYLKFNTPNKNPKLGFNTPNYKTNMLAKPGTPQSG